MSPALILLAAGSSSRMGRPKQLLPYRGVTLLRHAASVALASRCHPVIVVIGSQAEQMRAELTDLPVQIVNNPDWANGMGSSIRAGMEAISIQSPPPAVLIMLCDQPGVTADTLNRLLVRYESTNAPVVACSYEDTAGVPALFDRSLFVELSSLPDSAGAKELIRRHPQSLHTISFPNGALDIDTPDDYESLK